MTTDQKEKRNDEYNKYVKRVTPTHCLSANMLKAFILGGIICTIGQLIVNTCTQYFGLSSDEASTVQHDFDSHKLRTDSAKPVCTTRKLGRRRRSRSYNRLCKRSMLVLM